MFIVHVFLHIKPECIDAFIAATEDNASNSRREAGIARFDFAQQQDDPTRFVLVEVYQSEDDVGRHKETEHYARWRDAVPDMMVEPRYSIKFNNISPDDSGW
jgi:(4S)-4-hydroxy-5-phosphonooxypentane-2,3-dione isomerase